MQCPVCGRSGSAGAATCGHCGAVLQAAPGVVHPAGLGAQVAGVGAARAPTVSAGFGSAPGVAPPPNAAPASSSIPATGGDQATRYLCAAAHFDDKLTEQLIGKVLREPLRSVAHSPGVDLVAVVKYALGARRRYLVRDFVLLIIVAAVLVRIFYGGSDDPFTLLVTTLAEGYAAGVLVVSIEVAVARWGNWAQSLRAGAFRADAAPMPSGPAARAQVDHVERYADSNLTVYKDYLPFLGYGWLAGAWSVALDTTVAEDTSRDVDSFTVRELNHRLRDRLRCLDIPGIRVTERVFISGTDIHLDRRLLPDPKGSPPARIADALVDDLFARPEDRARPYLITEIVGWRGELVWTAFLRIVVTATSLFVEANYCVLPPLRMTYHEIDDALTAPRIGQVAKLVATAAARTPIQFVRCAPRLLRGVYGDMFLPTKVARQRRRIDQVYTFDHGALASIRESASDIRAGTGGSRVLGYQRYFQLLDDQMYTKIVENRIFESLIAFLREKNIDPAELIRRSETIVNNSTVTIGGNVQMNNSAIGGRNAMATRVRNAASNAAPGVGNG